jgi:hypothetical protein
MSTKHGHPTLHEGGAANRNERPHVMPNPYVEEAVPKAAAANNPNRPPKITYRWGAIAQFATFIGLGLATVGGVHEAAQSIGKTTEVQRVAAVVPPEVRINTVGPQMDRAIKRELEKGPQPSEGDVILNDGESFTVGPSSTVGNAMIRIDERAALEQGMLQAKATTESAAAVQPEAVVLPETRLIMWEDAQLRQFGETALLAAETSGE